MHRNNGRGARHCVAVASNSARRTALPRTARQRTSARHNAAAPAACHPSVATPQFRATSVLARSVQPVNKAAAGIESSIQCARHDALLTACEVGWVKGETRTTKKYTHARARASMRDLKQPAEGTQQQAAAIHRGRGGDDRTAGGGGVEVDQ